MPWLTVVLCHVIFAHYTDDFVVKLRKGENPDHVAASNNCINFGEFLPDYYHFQHRKVHRRSAVESQRHSLSDDVRILSFEQQYAKKRTKRDFNDYSEGNPPKDPLYTRMFYLNPAFPGRQSSKDIRHMNITGAWEMGYSGKGVVVTILDDGLEHTHSDLIANYDPVASYDINADDDDPTPSYNSHNDKIDLTSPSSYRYPLEISLSEHVLYYMKEINRHGTRCAGEIAATANNSACVPGIAYNAKVGGIRMLDGDVTDLVESKSISFRPDHVDIYSASWGPDDDGKTVDGPGELAKKAFENGALKGRNGLGSIFVWASGNGGRYSDNCNCDGYTNSIFTISISSTSQNEDVPWYSEACASTLASTYSSGNPSERRVITTDLRGICTEQHTGTSASAPIAAAIIALALEAKPTLNWRDVQHLLVRTSRKRLLKAVDWEVNSLGRDYSHRYGYGLIDAGALVEMAKTWTSVPPQRYYNHLHLDKKSTPILFSKHDDKALTLTVKVPKNTNIDKVEHVVFTASITFPRRGDLRIRVASPHGTESVILEPRPQDVSSKGFNLFKFLSVHYWDESPYGNWTLVIENTGRKVSEGSLAHFDIGLYGNGYDQYNVKCPKKQVLDITSGVCLDDCPKSTFRKAIYFNAATKKSYEERTPDVYQCHRCAPHCLICTGPLKEHCKRKLREKEPSSSTGLTPDKLIQYLRDLKRKNRITVPLYRLHMKVLKSPSFRFIFNLGAMRNTWADAADAYDRLFPGRKIFLTSDDTRLDN